MNISRIAHDAKPPVNSGWRSAALRCLSSHKSVNLCYLSRRRADRCKDCQTLSMEHRRCVQALQSDSGPPGLHLAVVNGGPIFLGLLFFWSFFFLLAFPWFFLGKQQFPYVLDGFGVIFLGFPPKNLFFAFPWFFLGKTAVSLCFGRIWRDFPWFSYEKTYSCP